jgi:hypothetical protein
VRNQKKKLRQEAIKNPDQTIDLKLEKIKKNKKKHIDKTPYRLANLSNS